MSSRLHLYSRCVPYFNSKRCDYEAAPVASATNTPDFNSKRCDYEQAYKYRVTGGYLDFNSKRCDYELLTSTATSRVMVNFNSKRCDYERTQIMELKDSLAISIPKGAIMSY